MKIILLALLGIGVGAAHGSSVCPFGADYFIGTNRCFLYGITPLSWDDARSFCQNRSGDLVSLHLFDELIFIDENMHNVADGVYWTGFSRSIRHTLIPFSWSDNSPINFTNWAEGVKCNHGKQDCMNVDSKSGFWYNCWTCDHKLPFVCEVPLTTTNASTRRPVYNATAVPQNFTQTTRIPLRQKLLNVRAFSIGMQNATVYPTNYTRPQYNVTDRPSNFSSSSPIPFLNFTIPTQNATANPPFYNATQLPLNFTASPTIPSRNLTMNPSNFTVPYNASQLPTTSPSYGNLSTTPSGTVCPLGTVYFAPSNRCFFVITYPQTWEQARSFCQSSSGDLLSIHTEAEAKFVAELMYSSQNYIFWSGLNKLQQTNFTWSDNSPVNYQNWGSTEKCYMGPQDCTSIESSTSLWYNCWPCTHQIASVCEVPLRNKATTPNPITANYPTTAPAKIRRLNLKADSVVDHVGAVHRQ